MKKYPDLPQFNIPESCQDSCKHISPEQYQEWVQRNVALLQEKGLYDKYRMDPDRTPVDARFEIKD
jgi:hypothetical protein